MLEKPNIHLPEVILPGENELQTFEQEQTVNFDLQTYSSYQVSSPLPASGCQTPVKCPAFNTDLRPPSPSIYSNVVFSQTLNSPPSPDPVPTYRQFSDWQHIRLQPGGDSETPECRKTAAPEEGSSSSGLDSPLPLTYKLSTFSLSLPQHLSPFSLSDFSSVSPSSAEANSPKPLFQSNSNSVLPLTPDIFTQSSALSDSFMSFLPHVCVDFSYCPVEQDPHVYPAL